MAKGQKSNTMVRFDDDIDNVIRDLAKKRGQTISHVIRGLVIEGLFNDEDVFVDDNGDFHC